MTIKPTAQRRPSKIWDIRQSAGIGALDLYIYDDVESDGENWWTGEKIQSETSANYFRNELAKYPNISRINIYINSRGGEVFEGVAIYSQLRRHPAEKIVYVDGLAGSIASVIAMAGDRVIMSRNSMMMIHNASSYAYGNAVELRKLADDLDVISEASRQAYLQKAGEKLNDERLAALMDNETWLTAESCIALGLADEYAESDGDNSAIDQALEYENKTIVQKIRFHQELALCLQEIGRLNPNLLYSKLYDDDDDDDPPIKQNAPRLDAPPAPPDPRPLSIVERLSAMYSQKNESEEK